MIKTLEHHTARQLSSFLLSQPIMKLTQKYYFGVIAIYFGVIAEFQSSVDIWKAKKSALSFW